MVGAASLGRGVGSVLVFNSGIVVVVVMVDLLLRDLAPGSLGGHGGSARLGGRTATCCR